MTSVHSPSFHNDASRWEEGVTMEIVNSYVLSFRFDFVIYTMVIKPLKSF